MTTKYTECESCNYGRVKLVEGAPGEIFDSGECPKCGYWITRYTDEFIDQADWLEDE